MIMNIIIPIENGRLIQIISITLQRLQGAGHIWKIIIVCKFVIPNRLLWGTVKFGWSLSLQICCPKPPSLQGALQFGWSLLFTNLLSQFALFAGSPPIWMIVIICKFLVPNRPLCKGPANFNDQDNFLLKLNWINWTCKMQGNALFSWKFYTTGKNFTRPPFTTVVTIFISAFW